MRGIRIAAAFALFAASAVPSALANPDGGQIVAGSATVQGQGTAVVTVNQSSQKTILNWDTFSIKEGELTKFLQPNAQAIALNRVIGSDPSLIYGTLSANGRLILINPNGLMIGPSGTVNANSFIASTAGISDENFLAGNLTFDIVGNANARIVNEGTVTAGDAGLVAFVAPAVKNSRLIKAKLGTVTLGAATKFTLDFYGDELVSFPIDAEVAQAADGAKALVEAGGRIEGQNIVLSARAARGVINDVIIADGELIARSASVVDGKIRLGADPRDLARTSNGSRVSSEFAAVEDNAPESDLASTGASGGTIRVDGGANGRVVVSGTFDASGTTGGQVILNGEEVHVTGRVLAEGATGKGGAINVSAARFISFAGLLSADGSTGGTITVRTSSGDFSLDGLATVRGRSGAGGSIDIVTTGESWEFFGSRLDVSGATDGGNIRNIAGEKIVSSATYAARGKSGVGGNVDVSAPRIFLLSSTYDASGFTNGGQVRLGGEFQGGRSLEIDDLPNAASIYLNDTTIIDVSSFGPNGPGGTAVVWSDFDTVIEGRVLALGGVASGSGGLVEASSGDSLTWLGSVETARDGLRGGTLLLDPRNIFIVGGGGSGGGGGGGSLGFNRILDAVSGTVLAGRSVSLDGQNLAVGALGDEGSSGNCFFCGAVYLFRFSDASLSGGTLVGRIGKGYTGPNNFDITSSSVGTLDAGDEFGDAVALKGLQLVVGASDDDGVNNTCVSCGAVYLFQFANANLGGVSGAGRIGSGYTGSNSFNVSNLHLSEDFGDSVAFDGRRLAVGAPDDVGFGDSCQGCGAVYLFEFASSGSFSTAGMTTGIIGGGYTGSRSLNMSGILDPFNPVTFAGGDFFGSSVAFDQNRLIIGATGDDGRENNCNFCGAVYIFSTASNSFTSISLAGRLGVGYTGSGYTGATSLDRNLSSFLGSNISFSDDGDGFGESVALEGTSLVVGAFGDDGLGNTCVDCGAAYLFSMSGLSATAQPTQIGAGYTAVGSVDIASELAPDARFGSSVSLSGGNLVAGARGRFGVGGKVFLFTPGGGGGGGLSGITFAEDPGGDTTITTTTLRSLLSSGTSVVLQANNDIFFGGISDPISLPVDNPNGVGGNLTFLAGRRIFFNGSLFTDGGDFTAIANAGTASGVVSAFRDSGVAAFQMTTLAAIDACATGPTVSCGDVFISVRNGVGQTYADSSDITLEGIRAGSILVEHLSVQSRSINSNGALTAMDSGAAIVLATPSGYFSNGCVSCSTNAITTPNGHWLIYGRTTGNFSNLAGQMLFGVEYNPLDPTGSYGAPPSQPYGGRFLILNSPSGGYSSIMSLTDDRSFWEVLSYNITNVIDRILPVWGDDEANEFLIDGKTFAVRGGDFDLRQSVADALAKIFSTPRGTEMLSLIKERWSDFHVYLSSGIAGGFAITSHKNSFGSNFVVIDPYYESKVATTAGAIPYTIERLLAHELGHAIFGTKDCTEGDTKCMQNVLENENPIMAALGQPERTSYFTPVTD